MSTELAIWLRLHAARIQKNGHLDRMTRTTSYEIASDIRRAAECIETIVTELSELQTLLNTTEGNP